ncbi:hypothetical protein [Kitasatospora sp. NPDC101183]|uniref:hypothetical protein n=1 Tax=Kitasatospora sp. NPDC101183 TaxID=3364100 RepID=UPI00380A171B
MTLLSQCAIFIAVLTYHHTGSLLSRRQKGLMVRVSTAVTPNATTKGEAAMADPGFKVQPAALTTYGHVTQTQSEHLSTIRWKLASITLKSSDFGHLPNAQHLFDEYHLHATAEQQNLSDLADILSDVVTGLGHTAHTYVNSEKDVTTVYGGAT